MSHEPLIINDRIVNELLNQPSQSFKDAKFQSFQKITQFSSLQILTNMFGTRLFQHFRFLGFRLQTLFFEKDVGFLIL